jgi:hypothetical protein
MQISYNHKTPGQPVMGGIIMIRVLLAEDQAMVRGALSALLSREKDIEVVAEVARGDIGWKRHEMLSRKDGCEHTYGHRPVWSFIRSYSFALEWSAGAN